MVRQLGARRCSPRGSARRRARPPASHAAARHAHAALAAAQARGRSAGRRGALRIVSGAPLDLPRVTARSLRHAGARRHLAAIEAATICGCDDRFTVPSPFAASLLFGYVANYIYDGDAPLAERRAQALVGRSGPAARAARRRRASRAARCGMRSTRSSGSCSTSTPIIKRGTADGLHDLLLRIGDLTAEEIAARSAIAEADCAHELENARRALRSRSRGEPGYVAGRRMSRGIGMRWATPLPVGTSRALLEPVALSGSATWRCDTRDPTDRSRPRVRPALRSRSRRPPKRMLKRLTAAGN